mgnify:CR=1 FL=1
MLPPGVSFNNAPASWEHTLFSLSTLSWAGKLELHLPSGRILQGVQQPPSNTKKTKLVFLGPIEHDLRKNELLVRFLEVEFWFYLVNAYFFVVAFMVT